MRQPAPGKFGYVNQSFYTAQVHKGPEIGEVGDHPHAHLAWSQRFQKILPGRGRHFSGPLGKDEPVCFRFHLDELQL